MTRRERALFWLLLIAAAVFILFVLRDVLLPFVAGMVIAYFFDPVVDRCERIGCSRTLGTSIVLFAFLTVMIGFVLLLVPVLNAQLVRLSEFIPRVIQSVEPFVAPIIQQMSSDLSGGPLEKLPTVASEGLRWLANLLLKLVSSGIAIANALSLMLITPVVAFYLLRDWDRIVARVDTLLPHAQRDTIREQVSEIDRTLAGYVRGQGSVCIVLAIFYGAALSLAGLDFGIVIGMIAGMISFVPFVGAIVGGLLSVGLAAVQFDSAGPILVIAGIFVVGQVLEGNFLTPKLVGDAVDLHPVWLIFGLLAGGVVFGMVGVLLALPVTAVVGVLFRFAVSRYLASPLHLQGIPPTDDAGTDRNPDVP